MSFDDLVAGGAPPRVQVPVGPDDIYHIRFSSGSTGRPKGIAISHRGARAAILGNTWVMSSSGPGVGPRTLQVAPLVYAGGWSVLPTLLCGGTNVVLERFDADEMLAHHRRRGITWMFAVPTMLRRMSDFRATCPACARRHCRCLMLAGEPAALPALEAGQRAHRRHDPVLGSDRGAGVDDAALATRDASARAVVVDRSAGPRRRVLHPA